MAASAADCCIFLFGNAARGDDALGEQLHTLLRQELARTDSLLNTIAIRLVADFQLQPEHIFDLKDARLGVFVDAHHDASSGVQWRQIQPGSQLQFSSHSLPVESLLFLYATSFAQAPPPCYLMTMGGEQFELGAGLSPTAQRNLQTAYPMLLEKLEILTAGAIS